MGRPPGQALRHRDAGLQPASSLPRATGAATPRCSTTRASGPSRSTPRWSRVRRPAPPQGRQPGGVRLGDGRGPAQARLTAGQAAAAAPDGRLTWSCAARSGPPHGPGLRPTPRPACHRRRPDRPRPPRPVGRQHPAVALRRPRGRGDRPPVGRDAATPCDGRRSAGRGCSTPPSSSSRSSIPGPTPPATRRTTSGPQASGTDPTRGPSRTGGLTAAWPCMGLLWPRSTPGWARCSTDCSTTRPRCSPRSGVPAVPRPGGGGAGVAGARRTRALGRAAAPGAR